MSCNKDLQATMKAGCQQQLRLNGGEADSNAAVSAAACRICPDTRLLRRLLYLLCAGLAMNLFLLLYWSFQSHTRHVTAHCPPSGMANVTKHCPPSGMDGESNGENVGENLNHSTTGKSA